MFFPSLRGAKYTLFDIKHKDDLLDLRMSFIYDSPALDITCTHPKFPQVKLSPSPTKEEPQIECQPNT